MGKKGLVGGVYLWINRENGNMYVGSSIHLYRRIKFDLNLERAHGIIGHGLRKYGLNGFVLVLFLFPNATSSLVLALEQSVLDNCTCAYNLSPTAGSPAGVKHSEETKAKRKGQKLSEEHKAKISASKGKAVYLYLVHADGLELSASFPNMVRCSETLGIPLSSLFHRIKNRTLFKMNGLQHILSRDGKVA